MEQPVIPVDLLKSGTAELGLELTDAQLQDFSRFVSLLLEWNQKMNLTRITEPKEVVTKHLLDSLTCLTAADFSHGASVIDVGTGAGLPGIPIKIARPDLEVTLLDATRKKLSFIEEVVRELGLQKVTLVHGRAEDVGQGIALREAFDVVIARAVADMRALAEYTLPLARIGGTVIIQKGPEVDEELAAAKKAVSLLGGRISVVKKVMVPQSDLGRSLIVIQKKSPTPKHYPRRQAEIAQKPL